MTFMLLILRCRSWGLVYSSRIERKTNFHASDVSDENIDDHNKSWNREIHYQQAPSLKNRL